MVLDIVKQAVQIKMTCRSECPLISEAEYCCACARALKELEAPKESFTEMRQAQRVEELRKKMTPYFREKLEAYAEQPQMHRLLSLLVHCRVEGDIMDEIGRAHV